MTSEKSSLNEIKWNERKGEEMKNKTEEKSVVHANQFEIMDEIKLHWAKLTTIGCYWEKA